MKEKKQQQVIIYIIVGHFKTWHVFFPSLFKHVLYDVGCKTGYYTLARKPSMLLYLLADPTKSNVQPVKS